MTEQGTIRAGLLEYLARNCGCCYLSDLHCGGFDKSREKILLELVDKLQPEAYPLREWNDALGYLADLPPEQSAGDAKSRLMAVLVKGTGRK